MGRLTITILDSIHSKANKSAREKILPCLAYEDVAWRRSRFGGKSTSAERYLITGRKGTGGTFLTGLLPRILEYAERSGFFVSVRDGNLEKIKPTRKKPKLKGIKFRGDQRRALRAIKRKGRGIIKFPTGSGKTIIALGMFSMYEKSATLFLCHTKDLLLQTVKEISLLPKKREIFILGASHKVTPKMIRKAKHPILISTVQSFSKWKPKEWCDIFDLIVVDECHKVNKKDSQYGKIMEYCLAPIRIGLSATPPKNGKSKLVSEGFFGPVIAELGMTEGIQKGIIAKPVINLVRVPEEFDIKKKAGKIYREIYNHGIIKNDTRNRLIVKEVKDSLKKDEIVLIVIENTEHGKLLKKMLKAEKIKAPFVYGSTDSEIRTRVKNKLKKRKLKVAICSKVWREGINIPALNHIINAHGMKEEKIILQAMGRGLRTSEGKTEIKLTDFLDPYTYLAQHAIHRIQIYVEQGWI